MSASDDDPFADSEEDEPDDAPRDDLLRQTLANFYNIPRPKEEVAHIDSPSFEADDYVGQLLQENSLEQLLETDDHLCHEVKTLDSDMQMLVYEVRESKPWSVAV